LQSKNIVVFLAPMGKSGNYAKTCRLVPFTIPFSSPERGSITSDDQLVNIYYFIVLTGVLRQC